MTLLQLSTNYDDTIAFSFTLTLVYHSLKGCMAERIKQACNVLAYPKRAQIL